MILMQSLGSSFTKKTRLESNSNQRLKVNHMKVLHCAKDEAFHLLKKSLMGNFIFCAVLHIYGLY